VAVIDDMISVHLSAPLTNTSRPPIASKVFIISLNFSYLVATSF